MPRRNEPIDVLRFVDERGPDECWEYRGYQTNTGYGAIQIDGKAYVAHRVVYWLSHPGSIELNAPTDKSCREFVLHKCDNRLCCNPAHLFLGNYEDNNRDRVAKGRSKYWRDSGSVRWNAKLTQVQAEEIRWISSKGIATTEIAPMYGVCPETIRKIVVGRAYRAR